MIESLSRSPRPPAVPPGPSTEQAPDDDDDDDDDNDENGCYDVIRDATNLDTPRTGRRRLQAIIFDIPSYQQTKDILCTVDQLSQRQWDIS